MDVFVTDPANWNSFAVLQWLADPVIRGSYGIAGTSIDSFLKCNNLKCERTAPNRYVVTGDYLTTSQLGQSPLNNPPSISFGQITYDQECDQDANGSPIITVTGEEFDPPITVQYFDVLLRVTRNLATYDDAWANTYRNTVNSQPWNGYAAGLVKLISLTGDSVLDSSFQYWKVSGEFQIKSPPPGKTSTYAWYRRVMARGNNIIVGGSVVAASSQYPVTGPVCHDTTTGAYIAPGGTAQWYYWQLFNTADFNTLGLI